MTEHIKCSEENADSVVGNNFDKENFVESDRSDSSDDDFLYQIHYNIIIAALLIRLLMKYYHLRRERMVALSHNEFLQQTGSEETESIRTDQSLDLEVLMLAFTRNDIIPYQDQCLCLKTDTMKSNLQSLDLITELPDCITLKTDLKSKLSDWDLVYAPGPLVRGAVYVKYNPLEENQEKVSGEFELRIEATYAKNSFELVDVCTHFCYIYAAIYNDYFKISNCADEDYAAHIQHLTTIFNNIERVKSNLEAEKNKQEIIVEIKLIKELDRKLLDFIIRVLQSRYTVNGDEFDIKLNKKDEIC